MGPVGIDPLRQELEAPVGKDTEFAYGTELRIWTRATITMYVSGDLQVDSTYEPAKVHFNGS